MPLQLSGSKTLQIAGSPLECIEVYTGESYVIPFQFTSGNPPTPVNITGWNITATAKWYTITANFNSSTVVNITSIELLDPQPSQPPNLDAVIISGVAGSGYIYVPTGVTPPGYEFALSDNPILLCLVTLEVSRVDSISGLTVINREPVGILVRYQ